MMRQKGMFPYLHLRDYHCSLIELPYHGEHMSMFILLSTSVEHNRIMERHMTGDKLVALLEMERPQTQVNLSSIMVMRNLRSCAVLFPPSLYYRFYLWFRST